MADPDIEIDSEALSDGESSRALDGPPPTSDVALPGGGEPEHGHVSSSHEQLRDKIGPKRAKKRRRTARACDECRCKKIKCDGRQPCEHCEGYDYECTYDKPHRRQRPSWSSPSYVKDLEDRLRRAEALLRRVVPSADAESFELTSSMTERLKAHGDSAVGEDGAGVDGEEEARVAHPDEDDAELMSTIKSIGELNLTETGEWDFHGISSGAVFLNRMKEHFQGLGAYDYRIPFVPGPPKMGFPTRGPATLQHQNDAPWDLYQLPPLDLARTLCHYALDCATFLLRIVHAPTFYAMFHRLYEVSPEMYTGEDRRFLSLFYAVLAVGCMFNIDEKDPSNPNEYKSAMELGMKYYSASSYLLPDVTACRDMNYLQAILFLTIFLQSISDLRGCNALLGVALRSALAMGLHRYLPHPGMNAVEEETRRRVFYVIRQQDIYLSAILGSPLLLSEDDFDQALPTEVNDEFITKSGIISPPPGTRASVFEAFNARVRLMRILAKVLRHVYPLKGIHKAGTDREVASYAISYARIKEIEHDLQTWHEELPPVWRPDPNGEGPIEVTRGRLLLRFTYAYVQMMLYRPFLHYLSPRLSAGKQVDKRAYACAALGVNVSRNTVRIGLEIQKRAVLIGPYWFILYSQFFATLSLVFYASENLDKADALDVLAEAMKGKEWIAGFAQLSLAADMLVKVLDSLFESLPEALTSAAVQCRNETTANVERPGSGRRSRAGERFVEIPKIPRQTSEPTMGGPGNPAVGKQPMLPRAAPRQQMPSPFIPHNSRPMNLDLSASYLSASAPCDISSSLAQLGPSLMVPQLGPGASSPLVELDSMMFPAGDPFAYPQYPVAGWSGQFFPNFPDNTPGLGMDPTHGYTPSTSEDMEGQLLGPNIGHLVQPWQESAPDFSSQMWRVSDMFGLQQQEHQDGTQPDNA